MDQQYICKKYFCLVPVRISGKPSTYRSHHQKGGKHKQMQWPNSSYSRDVESAHARCSIKTAVGKAENEAGKNKEETYAEIVVKVWYPIHGPKQRPGVLNNNGRRRKKSERRQTIKFLHISPSKTRNLQPSLLKMPSF